MIGGSLIRSYIVKAIAPYLLLSLFLLTMILFVQQASRFAELLLATQVPLPLLAEVALSIVPNVLAFTLPMAILAGTIIGFGRMSSDSELVAMRAAGASNLSLLMPVLTIGLFFSICAAYVNLEMAPQAAQSLRRAGIQAALHRLDSPVEPRTFTTEIPGYVVYVRDGDKVQGRWERVFIYSEDKSGSVRLITARSGRIDAAAEQSELVLTDAVATTIPANKTGSEQGQYITEKLAQLRVVLETGRKGLLERLRRDDPDPEEMGFAQLRAYANARMGEREGRESATLLHRRISLSVAPLVFALLGASLSLYLRRAGRGWGSLVSLIVLIAYYMLSLFGEQLARKGTIPPYVGSWAATVIALGVSFTLLVPNLVKSFARSPKPVDESEIAIASERRPDSSSAQERPRLLSFPSLVDMNLLRSLTTNFVFAYVTLIAIFLIFTLFELWRFIAPSRDALVLVGKYLLFLLPLATVQLMSASLLISVLVTYALMARRSEAVACWASGQSVYRLIIPGIAFALMVGLGVMLVQEKLLPKANLKQDALRSQIRAGVAHSITDVGRQWLASATTSSGRLYSYEVDEGEGRLLEPKIYEFDAEGVHLQRIVLGKSGTWAGDKTLDVDDATVVSLATTPLEREEHQLVKIEGTEPAEAFKLRLNKPSHLSANELSSYITTIKPSGRNVVPLSIALQKKYAEPHTPWIMALFGIPLALAFGRRSAVAALASAVAIGLGYWGIAGTFQQLGEYGLLSPMVAAWSPLLIFAALGVYLLTRMKT